MKFSSKVSSVYPSSNPQESTSSSKISSIYSSSKPEKTYSHQISKDMGDQINSYLTQISSTQQFPTHTNAQTKSSNHPSQFFTFRSSPESPQIVNPSTPFEQYISPQNEFEIKERNWVGIYLMASIPSFVLILILIIVILKKYKKKRNQSRRQRRSRIVRDLRMIQMSSVVNDHYHIGDEETRYVILFIYLCNNINPSIPTEGNLIFEFI